MRTITYQQGCCPCCNTPLRRMRSKEVRTAHIERFATMMEGPVHLVPPGLQTRSKVRQPITMRVLHHASATGSHNEAVKLGPSVSLMPVNYGRKSRGGGQIGSGITRTGILR